MEREQTTIRLTIRAPNELEDFIRDEAKQCGTNMNQFMLLVLNQWAQSRRVQIHNS